MVQITSQRLRPGTASKSDLNEVVFLDGRAHLQGFHPHLEMLPPCLLPLPGDILKAGEAIHDLIMPSGAFQKLKTNISSFWRKTASDDFQPLEDFFGQEKPHAASLASRRTSEDFWRPNIVTSGGRLANVILLLLPASDSQLLRLFVIGYLSAQHRSRLIWLLSLAATKKTDKVLHSISKQHSFPRTGKMASSLSKWNPIPQWFYPVHHSMIIGICLIMEEYWSI